MPHSRVLFPLLIHPTTYLRNDVWNAAYDAAGAEAPCNGPVLLNQVIAFNG